MAGDMTATFHVETKCGQELVIVETYEAVGWNTAKQKVADTCKTGIWQNLTFYPPASIKKAELESEK